MKVAEGWEASELLAVPERRAAACFHDADLARYQKVNVEWGGGFAALDRLQAEDPEGYALLLRCAALEGWEIEAYRQGIQYLRGEVRRAVELRGEGIDVTGSARYPEAEVGYGEERVRGE